MVRLSISILQTQLQALQTVAFDTGRKAQSIAKGLYGLNPSLNFSNWPAYLHAGID